MASPFNKTRRLRNAWLNDVFLEVRDPWRTMGAENQGDWADQPCERRHFIPLPSWKGLRSSTVIDHRSIASPLLAGGARGGGCFS